MTCIVWDQNLYNFIFLKLRGLFKRNLFAALLANTAGRMYTRGCVNDIGVSVASPNLSKRKYCDAVKLRRSVCTIRPYRTSAVSFRTLTTPPTVLTRIWGALSHCTTTLLLSFHPLPRTRWLHLLEGAALPPYSPGLSSFDFSLFESLKKALKDPRVRPEEYVAEAKEVRTVY
jgi:hypothetical protein